MTDFLFLITYLRQNSHLAPTGNICGKNNENENMSMLSANFLYMYTAGTSM